MFAITLVTNRATIEKALLYTGTLYTRTVSTKYYNIRIIKNSNIIFKKSVDSLKRSTLLDNKVPFLPTDIYYIPKDTLELYHS